MEHTEVFDVTKSDQKYMQTLYLYVCTWFIPFPCTNERRLECKTRLESIILNSNYEKQYYQINMALILRLIFRQYVSIALYDNVQKTWTVQREGMDSIIISCEYVLRKKESYFQMWMLRDAEFKEMAKMSPRTVRINRQ